MEAITYDQVLALFAETRLQIKTLSAETDKQIKTLSAETDKQIKTLSAETDKQIKSLSVASAETSKQIAETDKQLKVLARRVGDVTDTMGRFAEEQVRPKILELFKERGVELEETYPRVTIKKNGQFLLEIDLLLVNTIYSVVVEVQATPNRAIKGTTMYGAVAGMIVTEEVEKYAIKKGFYVIKPKGDNVEISNKPNFKPKEWALSYQ
jgi:uncharacterized coiled-coil protein SlyX